MLNAYFSDKEAILFGRIYELLGEGLDIIGKYEKLSRNEGQIKLVFAYDEKECGLELYAPHLVPNALCYSWTATSFEKAFTNCIKDLTAWVEIERDAPRDKFGLDF